MKIQELVGLCIEKGVIIMVNPCGGEILITIKKLTIPAFEVSLFSSRDDEEGVQDAIDKVKAL